jgi:hypothetical protein
MAVVLAALRAHSGKENVAEYGCKALAYMAFGNPDNATRLLETEGALTLIVSVMRAHANTLSVVVAGCNALINLAYHSAEHAAEVIRMDKTVEATVTALTMHGRSQSRIAEFGCWTLACFSTTSENADRCVASCYNIVVAVLSALRGRVDDAEVTRRGCWALANFALFNTNAAQQIIDGGSTELVVDLLQRHTSHRDAAEYACKALQAMATHTPANAQRVIAAGAIAALEEVRRAHPPLTAEVHEALRVIKTNASRLAGPPAPLPPAAPAILPNPPLEAAGGAGGTLSAPSLPAAAASTGIRSIHWSDLQLAPGPPLGEGGFGRVHKATWKSRGMLVAVKMLYTDAALFSKEDVEDFQREVATHFGLRGLPGIVNVYGSVVDETTLPKPTYAIVMELMSNSLENVFVRAGAPKATLKTRLTAVLQSAQGLHQLHAERIMHLDLKPLNIMLDRHGEARLTDFGLAQMRAVVTRTSASQRGPTGNGMAGVLM